MVEIHPARIRSGATMNSVTALLYERAGAAEVYALTLTRTRSAH